MPMPKPVFRTSLNNKWVQYDACITCLGGGVGMNITAQRLSRAFRRRPPKQAGAIMEGMVKRSMCTLVYDSVRLRGGSDAQRPASRRAGRSSCRVHSPGGAASDPRASRSLLRSAPSGVGPIPREGGRVARPPVAGMGRVNCIS